MEEVMGAGAQAGEQKPGERGLNVSVGGGTGEMQAAVIQLGRIADQLQELVKQMKSASPVKPQPFGG